MFSTCHLIIDPPADGAWNMALDEALLLQAEASGVASLRFYAWGEPTLSLGYFQPHADRAGHAASRSCALVRRASGGGAILHDSELTYSLALSKSHRLARRPEELYFAAHETLIESLAALGICATLCDPAENSRRSSTQEPFLCFQRRVRGDVLIGQHKVAGSAQRRHGGAVLQHGSVLLKQSPCAPELPGIAELGGTTVSFDSLRKVWQPRLADRLAMKFVDAKPSATTQEVAAEIARTKFASPDWTRRR